jgi:hypothetical protein
MGTPACRSGQFELTGCWYCYHTITMPCMPQAKLESIESSHSQPEVLVNRDVGSPRVSSIFGQVM